MTDPNENQGRGDRPQLPEGSGFVVGLVLGVAFYSLLVLILGAM